MDPDKALDAATEGAKALTKFQEIILKFLSPWNTRKQSDADTYANEQKLKTIRDNPDMDILFIGDEMHARARTPEALAERAALRQSNESIRQQRNLENVLEAAVIEIQSAEAVSDIPVDDDWTTRFFSIAKDVNSEEMQYLWGKILADEIVKPGSFSLRTLDVVRNLSRTDAEAFQKIVPLVIRHGKSYFLPSNSKVYSQYGLSYSDFLLLDECGLVSSDSMLSLNLELADKQSKLLYTDERLIIIRNPDESAKKISVGVYTLTKVGVELYSVLQHIPNNDYFLAFAKQVREENKDVAVELTIHQVNKVDGDNINYKAAPIVFLQREG